MSFHGTAGKQESGPKCSPVVSVQMEEFEKLERRQKPSAEKVCLDHDAQVVSKSVANTHIFMRSFWETELIAMVTQQRACV